MTHSISDEEIKKLRDGCKCSRDMAMIDLLYSTGIRVVELVNLNIAGTDFEERKCVVFGKGGADYIRASLCADVPRLEEAYLRIKRLDRRTSSPA